MKFTQKRTQQTSVDLPHQATGRTYGSILRSNLFSFFHLLLFSVGVILMFFGRYNDAFITASTGLISAVVDSFQEIRAKRQLDKITLLIRPVAHVIRNQVEESIDPAQLVQGDLIHLRPGDQALADGVVNEGRAEMDESLLTGESDLVRKAQADKILSGSFCVNGELFYHAEAVGAASFANQLTAAARTFTPVSTPLQQQVALSIRLLMVLTAIMALVFYLAGIIHQLNFVQNVEASAVLIGLIPYGLFLTISVAYTLGAIKIAGKGAVVQHTNAVEALHYVDVLCMDKTGTLTTNALQLDALYPLDTMSEPDVRKRLGDFAHNSSTNNGTNAAIKQAVAGQPRTPIDEVPFASLRKWSALLFDGATDGGLFVLGAPEVLMPLLTGCDTMDDTTDDTVALTQQVQSLSDQGLRVLLFAHNPSATSLRDATDAPHLPSLQPLALVTLRDELRPHAREILQEFSHLGVRLKIISGDNPHTVAALVKQTGLTEVKLVTGDKLATMSAAEFEQTAEEATIFGRVSPEQKARLIEAMLQRGHYVAMIGDGINDILALKKAKLGIAMQSGSAAARDVADMVLLNDSYSALVPALSEGKRIINGITNATYLLLARSLTYAFVIIGALMVGLDFPFEPAQAGITAITVGLPSFFLTLWARPNAKQEPLLRSLVRFVLPVALWSMLIGIAVYAFVYFRANNLFTRATIPPPVIAMFENATGLTYQADEQQFGLTASRIVAQTALSTFLSLSALILILFLEPPLAFFASWRAVSPDRRPLWLTVGLLILMLVGLNIPQVSNYFGFVPLSRPIWPPILVGLLLWVLGLQLLWRKRWVDRLLVVDG